MSGGPNVVPLKTVKRQRKAGATSGGEHDDDLPIIQIHSGKLPEATDQLAAAYKRTPGDLFQQSGRLVRPKSSLIANADGRKTPNYIIESAGTPYLMERAGRAAHFQKYDGRAGGWVDTDCPKKLVEVYADRSAHPELRELAGIITAPTLRPNGSLLSVPGHDAATNLLYLSGDQAFPRIPHRPDRNAALEALALLDRDLVMPFPFVDEASRSAALAALLASVTRRTLPTSPMTAVNAHVAASGKTHFCNLVSMVAIGRPAPAITQGRTEEEFEKRVGAGLIGGMAVLLIDNCEYPLGGAFLCQVVSEESSTVRLLGASRNVEVLNNALIMANGNNLILTGDITRRAIQCTLDPQVERPELRRFDSDPLALVRANRGKYVAAALTILRAHMLAG